MRGQIQDEVMEKALNRHKAVSARGAMGEGVVVIPPVVRIVVATDTIVTQGVGKAFNSIKVLRLFVTPLKSYLLIVSTQQAGLRWPIAFVSGSKTPTGVSQKSPPTNPSRCRYRSSKKTLKLLSWARLNPVAPTSRQPSRHVPMRKSSQ